MKKLIFTLICILTILAFAAPAAAVAPGIPGYNATFKILFDGLSSDYWQEIPGTHVDFNSAEQERVIYYYQIYLDPGESASFSITQSDGSIISGSVSYITSGWFDLTESIFQITLNGATENFSQFAAGYRHGEAFSFYAVQKLDRAFGLVGIPPYTGTIGGSRQPITDFIFCETSTDLLAHPFMQLTVDSAGTYPVRIYSAEFGEYWESAEKIVNTDWQTETEQRGLGYYIDVLFEFLEGAAAVIITTMSIFKFIFIDYFGPILILFECIIISYSAYHSQNPVTFARRVIKANKEFFSIVLGAINMIVDFFYKIIQTLKP